MINRRNFLKFAGLTGIAAPFLGKSTTAEAATWQKIADTKRIRFPQRGVWRQRQTLAGGFFQTAVLRSDGTIFSAGINSNGQLGDNTATQSRSAFIQAAGMSNIVAVASQGASASSYALRGDGNVFSCGYNNWGQLGDNTTANKSSYVQAIGISSAISIAAGARGAIAIRADGNVFTCGGNAFGELGINSTASTSAKTFVQATGISNAVAVAGGYQFFVALRSDGNVFACGDNTVGQLGINSTASNSTFVQSTGISNAIAISAGQTHVAALRADGNVFTCGINDKGMLGDNTLITKKTFIQAVGISSAIAIACGQQHTVALRADGNVFSCGYNNLGQLGVGDQTDRSAFTATVGISNAAAIVAGVAHIAALRADGLLYAAGSNSMGELGDNTNTIRLTFIQATTAP